MIATRVRGLIKAMPSTDEEHVAAIAAGDEGAIDELLSRYWERAHRVAFQLTGDADAADKVRRYQRRPRIEVYDLATDPLEWNNIAGSEEVAEVEKRLRAKLDAWMEAQGDKGQATELAARERQGGGKKRGAKKKTKKEGAKS